MSDYIGMSPVIFDEPEYRSHLDFVIAFYIILNADIAGVCPFRVQVVASKCRTSCGKVVDTVNYFQKIGKLVIGNANSDYRKWTHVWWKSVAWHRLFKGRCSSKVKLCCGKVVTQWGNSETLFPNFQSEFSQLYERKYNLVIPYPKKTDTLCIPRARNENGDEHNDIQFHYSHKEYSHIQSPEPQAGDKSIPVYKKPEEKSINQKTENISLLNEIAELEQIFTNGQLSKLEFNDKLVGLYIKHEEPIPKIVTLAFEHEQKLERARLKKEKAEADA
jgi:hypothetical protein